MGLVCIQNSSLLVYSKSQKVSASYCLPFQHSRGKNQPVGGFRPPPGLFRVKVHSLSSGRVAATPILNPSHRNFRLLFSKLQYRCTLTRQFSPNVAHKGGDKEKITAIYCLWMVDNKPPGEQVIVKNENFKVEIIFSMKFPYNYQPLFA